MSTNFADIAVRVVGFILPRFRGVGDLRLRLRESVSPDVPVGDFLHFLFQLGSEVVQYPVEMTTIKIFGVFYDVMG